MCQGMVAEVEQLRKVVARACREVIRPRARQVDEGGELPRENLALLAELGLFGIEIPPEYGGAGLGAAALAAVCEELSWACPSTETVFRASLSLTTYPLLHFGSDGQKGRFLPKMATGELLGAFALSEPEAGSDVRALKTRAQRTDGGYRLNGQKMFISNAGCADLYLVFARTEGEGSRILSAFLVPADRPGLAFGKKLKKMGRHGSVTAPMFLDDVEVSEDERLGDEGRGLRIAFTTMVHGRAMLAAAALGIGRAVLEIACQHAQERIAFGRPLGAMQAVQLKLAEIDMQLEAARGLVRRAVEQLEAGQDATRISAMAKVFASSMAVDACREAMQVMGGAGYMKDSLVEMFYRDIKLFEIAEGANDVLLLLIARQLGLPRWDR